MEIHDILQKQICHILYSILEKKEKIKESDKEKSLHSKNGMVYFASMSFSPDSADGDSDHCLICGDY